MSRFSLPKKRSRFIRGNRPRSQTSLPPPDAEMTVSDFYNRIFTPWLESQVATGQKSYATLVSYRRYWKSYVADHFNGTKTLRNYEPYQGLQFLQNLRKDDDTPLGQNTMK